MVSGVHYWELEVVKVGEADGNWMFGVCRPEIDVDDGRHLYSKVDAWLIHQLSAKWEVYGMDRPTGKGCGIYLMPKRWLMALGLDCC